MTALLRLERSAREQTARRDHGRATGPARRERARLPRYGLLGVRDNGNGDLLSYVSFRPGIRGRPDQAGEFAMPATSSARIAMAANV